MPYHDVRHAGYRVDRPSPWLGGVMVTRPEEVTVPADSFGRDNACTGEVVVG